MTKVFLLRQLMFHHQLMILQLVIHYILMVEEILSQVFQVNFQSIQIFKKRPRPLVLVIIIMVIKKIIKEVIVMVVITVEEVIVVKVVMVVMVLMVEIKKRYHPLFVTKGQQVIHLNLILNQLHQLHFQGKV